MNPLPTPVAPLIRLPRIAESFWTRETNLWLLAVALLLLTGFYKNINLLVILGYFFALVWIVNFVVARRDGLHLDAIVTAPETVYAGQSVHFPLAVNNHSASGTGPFRVVFRIASGAVGWLIREIPSGETLRLRAEVAFPTRGRQRIEPVEGWFHWPFGVVQHRRSLNSATEVMVLPAVGRIRCELLLMWLMRSFRGEDGSHSRYRHISQREADLHGLRVYRTGDSPRWIHWRTTARRGEPMVREFEENSQPNLLLYVDPAAIQPQQTEWVISLAASICLEWSRDPVRKMLLVLKSPGGLAGFEIRGNRPLMPALLALAQWTQFSTAPVEVGEWQSRLANYVRSSPVVVVSGERGRATALPPGTTPMEIGAGESLTWYEPPS